MALVIHIAVMLALAYGYSQVAPAIFDRLLGKASTLQAGVWLYAKGLVLLVLLPFVTAELLCMAWLSDWGYNRYVVLVPHFVSLVSHKRMVEFIKTVVNA